MAQKSKEKPMTQTKKPHVHAELIKAWADGANIQICQMDSWYDVSTPSWDSGLIYRTKPEPIKTERYRRWVSKISKGGSFEYCLRTICFGNYGVDTLHCQAYFVRWIDTEWQEGIVVDD
jgi:hypothetical protein